MNRPQPTDRGDINGVCLVLGSERYVILFDDANRGEALRQCGRWATNPELSFSWWAASVVAARIRGEPAAGDVCVRIAQ